MILLFLLQDVSQDDGRLLWTVIHAYICLHLLLDIYQTAKGNKSCELQCISSSHISALLFFINCVPHDSYEFLQAWNLKITMVFCTMGDRGVSRLVSVLLSSASLSLSLPLSLTKQICRFMPLCSLQGGGGGGRKLWIIFWHVPPGLISEIKGVFLSLHAATQQR